MADERPTSVSALRDKFNKPSPSAASGGSDAKKDGSLKLKQPSPTSKPSSSSSSSSAAASPNNAQSSFEASVQSGNAQAVPVLPVNVLGELDSKLKDGARVPIEDAEPATISPRSVAAKPAPPLPKKPSSEKLELVKARLPPREEVKQEPVAVAPALAPAVAPAVAKEPVLSAPSTTAAAKPPAAAVAKEKTTTPTELPPAALPARKSELDKFSAAAASVISLPPTEEEQDQVIVWFLSFVVPFFLLPIVYEVVRRVVLKPVRMGIKYAPGAAKLLTWLYLRYRPFVQRGVEAVRARLPSMERVNAAFKAGTELWLSTMQTALDRAWPHLLDLANAVKNLKFREAASQAWAVLQAWGPMLLLIVPLSKSMWNSMAYASVQFLRLSQRFFSAPFGHILRRLVQGFGESLADNADDVAERMAGVLGPLIGIQVLGFILISLLVNFGVIGASTLEALYIAWLFRLVGVLQPEVPLVVPGVHVAAAEVPLESVAAVDTAAAAPTGWFW